MENKIEKFTIFDDLLLMMKKNLRQSAFFVVLSFPLIFVLRMFNITVPSTLLIFLFIFIIALFLCIYLLVKKISSFKQFENLSLSYFSIIVILYTVIIHYLGGIETFGVLLYMTPIIITNIVVPSKKRIIVPSVAIISFSVMGFLEYFGIIPHQQFSFVEPIIYNNIKYVVFLIFFGAFFGFNYVGVIASNFASAYRKASKILKEEREKLMIIQSQLKESKETLEIRVEARTKELKEFTDHLEEEAKNRTKELQDKINELEDSRQKAVNRELKMIDLKEKIKGG